MDSAAGPELNSTHGNNAPTPPPEDGAAAPSQEHIDTADTAGDHASVTTSRPGRERDRSEADSGRNGSETRGRECAYPDFKSFEDRRDDIMYEVRRKTRDDWSRTAVDAFLDNFQAVDLILKAATWTKPASSSRSRSRLGSPTRHIAKPELHHMSWKDWGRSRRRRNFYIEDGKLSAIDVLDEEAQPRSSVARRRTLLSTGSAGTSGSTEGRAYAHPRADGTKPEVKALPSRIRINSIPAKRILDSVCDDDLLFGKDYGPAVIVRPYKVLVHYEPDIRQKMAEIENLHKERLERPATSDAPVEQETAETVADRHDNADGTVNGHTIPPNDGEDAVSARADERSERSVRSVSPGDMMFSTGTDWSMLTDADIKEATDDFRCLVQYLDEILMPVRRYLQSQPKEVNFHNIWHLFSTGALVYVRDRSMPQKVWRVIQATGGRKYLSEPIDSITGWESKYSPFVLDCYHLDFDGSKFVRVYHRFKIEFFEDPTLVSNLQIMPLAVAEQAGLVKIDHLRKRGIDFLTYTEPSSSQHREYHGITVTRSPSGEPLFRRHPEDIGSQRLFTERVDSQVVVDFERAIRANPEWGPSSNDIELWKIDQAELDDDIESVEKDSLWDSRASDDFLREEQEKWQSWDKGETVPEGDDVLLFPNRVFGYVLRTRSWACLRLSADDSAKEYKDHLDPVKRRPDAWQDLEIPDGHKSIVQALINTHFSKDRSKTADFDLVLEKGKGVIILLHGVPGVGKTATAECVAASQGRPLLPITCGDLGLKPQEVEATLQTAFQLAQAWDCVMLLDEADIFLAQRTNQDVERNALVSVFLRILEYYEGILFLTTNRVGSFDEAFKSRIHMALYYPPLNWLTTDKIWRNLIRRAKEAKVECNDNALIEFAYKLREDQHSKPNTTGPTWNGRQIRNAFQSALALARNESVAAQKPTVQLETRHFRTVAEVSNEFNQYILRVKSGRSDADIMQEVGARADDYHYAQYAQTQFPPPQMPMRQATPAGGNPMMGFGTPQSAQQGYAAANGSPYHPGQQPFYGNLQPQQQQQPPPPPPPPSFNMPQGYGQQPARAPFGQPMQQQPYQAPPTQQYQTPTTQPYQSPPQQQQQPLTGYAAPGAQHGFTMAGAAEPGSVPAPQEPQAVQQRA